MQTTHGGGIELVAPSAGAPSGWYVAAPDGSDGDRSAPTYGYHRVTALLNRIWVHGGNPPLNRKRIYRMMKTHHLLLQRHTGRPHRTHDGRVLTRQSNMRWCSDVFSIQCWNGDRVHVVFSVEARFGSSARLTTPVQWLSDNICTTPAYSPESNGMTEAFVKTFKRDYTWVADLSSASVVMGQLSGWFQDYNEHAPHKGLGMQSPRQYRRTVPKMEPDAHVT